jgi:hypothetical protein
MGESVGGWGLEIHKCTMMTMDLTELMPCTTRGFSWMPCAAHIVNLAMEEGLKVPEVAAVVEVVKSLVTWVDKSPKLLCVQTEARGLEGGPRAQSCEVHRSPMELDTNDAGMISTDEGIGVCAPRHRAS